MKYLFLLLTAFSLSLYAQDENTWPKTLVSNSNKIVIYQPTPDTYKDTKLTARAAVSVTPAGSSTPVFGAIWLDCTVHTDRDKRLVYFDKVIVSAVKFPTQPDQDKTKKLQTLIETEAPTWDLVISLDDLLTSLDAQQQSTEAANFKNEAPEMIFVTEPSVLVAIDGDPKLEKIDHSSIERVVNTAFFIVKENNTFYLSGSDFWFTSNDLKGSWTNVKEAPASVKKIYAKYKTAEKDSSNSKATTSNIVPKIYVRTTPAELIESSGEMNFKPIQGTQLLYVSNTENDVFMDIQSQQYYVLVSGRWFTSTAINKPWSYTASDKLPADFSKIPEGSDKDDVLAFVAGTQAAKEAILDASIPQTAAVDRSKATCTVSYDGDPKFEKIDGTNLYHAVNTTSTVLMEDKVYYVCENAVWFEGSSPNGPWKVADKTPKDLDKIPASSSAYNTKYVYIYDSTPEVVYVGYTPGYVGCYVYGPTIVYGTGWMYNPWYGPYYYPRPVTYGFSFHYNPYYGWSMGMSMSVGGPIGWCTFSFGGPAYGGWWGPPMYRPPVYVPYNHYYGPNRPVIINHNTNVIINNNNIHHNGNNIYNHHTNGGVRPGGNGGGVQRPISNNTRPGAGGAGTQHPGNNVRPGSNGSGTQKPTNNTRPSAGNSGTQRPNNNIVADRDGNVFKNNNGALQQYNGQKFQNTENRPQIQQQFQNMNRGGERFNNSGGGRPMGGGGRMGGGGGFRR